MAGDNTDYRRAIQQSLVGEQLTHPKWRPPGLHGDRCENDVDRVISVYYGGPAMTTIEWKVCDDHADEVRGTGEVREDREIQHSVECGGCGGETFEFERYCHRCGFDRWDGN